MSTIVFHSSGLGVTEYEEEYTGLAGDMVATAEGVFHVEQSEDNGVPIVARAGIVAINAEHGAAKRVPTDAWVQADTDSVLSCIVTELRLGGSYTYAQQVVAGRTRRFRFGRGIRDSYLGFELRNPDGEPFHIDRIEVTTRDSAQRKAR